MFEGVQVTDMRRNCMPFDGTWDFWVLLLITGAPHTLRSQKSCRLTPEPARRFHPHPHQVALLTAEG